MTRSAQAGGRPTQIADLRAGVFAAKKAEKPPKAPKQPKQPKETPDERAEKAERIAQAQHTTSLLGKGKDNKPYKRPGEKPEKKKGGGAGFLFQLIAVMIVAGGVALALDPSILPIDWQELRATVKSWL